MIVSWDFGIFSDFSKKAVMIMYTAITRKKVNKKLNMFALEISDIIFLKHVIKLEFLTKTNKIYFSKGKFTMNNCTFKKSAKPVFVLSFFVLITVNANAQNIGFWTGATQDYIISEPGVTLFSNPEVLIGRNNKIFGFWQEIPSYGQGSSPSHNSHELVSDPDTYNYQCRECEIDVVKGWDSYIYAVWSQVVSGIYSNSENIYFSYRDTAIPVAPPEEINHTDLWPGPSFSASFDGRLNKKNASMPVIEYCNPNLLFAAWVEDFDALNKNIQICQISFNNETCQRHYIENDFGFDEGVCNSDIALECFRNEIICLVWIDYKNEKYVIKCSHADLSSQDINFCTAYRIYELEDNSEITHLSLSTVPSSIHPDELEHLDLQFHLSFATNNINSSQYKILYARLVMENNLIVLDENSTSLVTSYFYEDEFEIDPFLLVDADEHLYITWAAANTRNSKVCYFAHSVNGGSNWSGYTNPEFDIISFPQGYNVHKPVIKLKNDNFPYVVWKGTETDSLNNNSRIQASEYFCIE